MSRITVGYFTLCCLLGLSPNAFSMEEKRKKVAPLKVHSVENSKRKKILPKKVRSLGVVAKVTFTEGMNKFFGSSGAENKKKEEAIKKEKARRDLDIVLNEISEMDAEAFDFEHYLGNNSRELKRLEGILETDEIELYIKKYEQRDSIDKAWEWAKKY